MESRSPEGGALMYISLPAAYVTRKIIVLTRESPFHIGISVLPLRIVRRIPSCTSNNALTTAYSQ